MTEFKQIKHSKASRDAKRESQNMQRPASERPKPAPMTFMEWAKEPAYRPGKGDRLTTNPYIKENKDH